jgi:nitroreductase / dihydropteridine reductase
MNLIQSLEWRYASKRMNGQRVPEEKINTILEAIRLAPSSMGLQPYTVLVIEDEALKKQIQPVANNQPQIVESSHLLVFAAWGSINPAHIDAYIHDIASVRNVPEESLSGFKEKLMGLAKNRTQEQNFNWAARQVYIAFGTALVAAAELKIDATPMEGFNTEALDELLQLREQGLRSVALLPLGYRDTENDWLAKQPKVRRKKEQLFIFDAVSDYSK